MSDVEKEFKFETSKDLGRARQRKMKRDGVSTTPAAPGTPATRRTTRRSPAQDEGPTTREQRVSNKVKLPNLNIPDVPGKIGAKLTTSPKKTVKKVAAASGDLVDKAAQSISRPRRQARKPENTYQAAAHAETQRKTRSDEGFVLRKNRRVYEAHSDSTPPVMVRGGMSGMAFGRTATSRVNKQKAPKRRIDVPLHVPGSEVRLPSLPMLRVGWRAVSFFMVVMMAACLVLIWKAPVFQVRSLQVVGLERLTMSDLNAVARAAGKSIFTIDPQKVDESLQQAFPELSKISVKVNLPASVKVVVTERVPVISWIQDGNEVWIDEDGYSFPVRGTISTTLVRVEGQGIPPTIALDESNTADSIEISSQVPISSTVVPSFRMAPDLVSAILSLGAKMPPDTLLVYDNEHGLGWNDPKGWDVFFGAEDKDMEMKLAVYQSLVERLESQGIQPALISVEYVHAPYYRMER